MSGFPARRAFGHFHIIAKSFPSLVDAATYFGLLGAMRQFLLVCQVYPPDAAAVGQHMADVAEALAARGHSVWVVTSNRDYDNPTRRYAYWEVVGGVRVIRLPLTSFGKSSLRSRIVGGMSLVVQASVFALGFRHLDRILLTTAPPMDAVVGIVARLLRGVPFDYWLMDINPDQAVALGRATESSIQVRLLESLNRLILRYARNVITLDAKMAARFQSKEPAAPPPRIVPAWALEEPAAWSRAADSPLRIQYGLVGKRVIMYSGNHSIAHPLTDMVEAAKMWNSDRNLRFMFIGGGLGKQVLSDWIELAAPTHVLSLPYQPRENVTAHLSMSDVQLVVVGPATIGIVHPSKIYGAMAAGRPILVLGPKDSPAAEIVHAHGIGWVVEPGDATGLQLALQDIESASDERLEHMGKRARELACSDFSRVRLIEEVIRIVCS